MNVEAALIQFLASELSVPVSAEVPADRPASFVTVERVGGPASEFVDRGSYAVQAWALSRFDASVLAGTIRNILPYFATEVGVAHVGIDSMYPWPDPESRQSRYQVLVDVAVKWDHQ